MNALREPLAIPVSTTGRIDGREIAAHVAPVFGLIARSTGTAAGLRGTFKSLKVGEVVEFTESLESARETAVQRLVEHAQAVGGDAVIGLRFDSTNLGENQGMAEIVAYGTAVRLAP